mgnify:CR=1 FL=1
MGYNELCVDPEVIAHAKTIQMELYEEQHATPGGATLDDIQADLQGCHEEGTLMLRMQNLTQLTLLSL